MLQVSGWQGGLAGVSRGLGWQVAVLGAMLVAAAALFFALTWLLRCEELGDLYGIARGRTRAVESVAGN